MKDETHGIAIQEFVGFKSKMYSMSYEEDGKLTEKKTDREENCPRTFLFSVLYNGCSGS
jgi:hypothetical protein